MLRSLALSGILLLTSTGLSLGSPKAPSAAGKTFALTETTPPVATTPDRRRSIDRTILRARDGLFYVNASVNGKAVRFIVDTGSNIVVLTKSDAARIGMVPSSDGAALQTVGGASAMQRGSVDHLVVAGQSITDVDAAAVDSGLAVSLLGQSALSRLQSLRFEGDRLELN